MIQIPHVKLAAQHGPLREELLAAVGRVIDHSQFILGEEVDEFERQFADYCGVQYAVGVGNGTDALILALKALGIGPGDEVITAPNSFVASASCIALLGARPTFVDVRDDFNIDPSQLEAAITSRTKAILPVHLTGRPADMDPILAIARAHNLYVVEDAAQAAGAEYRGRRTGSFGDVGCFSLHPLKTLNACGDAGIMTTNDAGLYEQFKVLRNLGLKNRDECVIWSENSRLDTMQAAILLVKLRYLDQWTERRRANARYYQERLAELPYVQIPIEESYERSVYHGFVIQADRRDALQAHLRDRGIGSAVHYPIPIHRQQVAAHLGHGPGSFPVTERQAQRILSLPVYQELSHDELEAVVESVLSFYG